MQVISSNNSIRSLIIGAFLLFIRCVLGGSIQSWEIEAVENYKGYVTGFRFPFNLESGLEADNYIVLTFPSTFPTLGTSPAFTLYIYENDLLLQASSNCAAQTVTYVQACRVTGQLQPGQWYILELTLPLARVISSSDYYQSPVAMQTISDTCTTGPANCQPIIFDQSHAFGYIPNPVKVTQAVTKTAISFNAASTEVQRPGSKYYAYLDLTFARTDPFGVVFLIQILPQTALVADQFNFIFRDSCYSDALDCTSATTSGCVSIAQVNSFNLNYFLNYFIACVCHLCLLLFQIPNSECAIQKNGNVLRISINQSVSVGSRLRIKVGVQNPLAKLTADLSVQGLRRNSYRTLESGLFVSALSTTQVQIYKGLIKYLWGINQNESTDMPIGLFKSGSTLLAANSVRISFFVDLELPVGKEYLVKVCLGEATGIIVNSVVTNLPRYDYQNDPNCYQNIIGTKLFLECNSVGALSKKNYEYFVAVKVYYAQNTIVNFGAVVIVLKDFPSVTLYKTYAGETVIAKDNTEYLDTTGFHSTALFGFGSTQIVTTIDSKKPAALPNGVELFLSSNIKNTIGITPSSVSNQELLFFLKVLPAHYTAPSTIEVVGNTADYVVRMSVLYNSNVIQYETSDIASAGLDFAAYQAPGVDLEKWTVDQIQCYKQNVCSWEGSLATMKNSLERSSSASSAPYAIHRFECLTKNQVDCDNWKGFQKVNGYSGVFGMRKIKFPVGFQSQLQAGDGDVLDFVISFHIGKYTAGFAPSYTHVTSQLINAYTVNPNKLSSAKISFVNFSDRVVNPGHKFPTFLRVGGTVNPSEHLGATTIAVFFDTSVDFSAFYEDTAGTQGSKSIGCSSKSCKVYHTAADGQDAWMNSATVIATGVRDKENDFELLIPLRNVFVTATSSVLFPKRLVIAFCDFNKISSGVQHQLRVLSVYRVFGSTVNGDTSISMSTINNLGSTLLTSALTFSSNSWFTNVASGSTYSLLTGNVGPMGVTDTSITTTAQTITNHNAMFDLKYYGAGVTLSSLYYDVFSPSWIGLSIPPFGVTLNCTRFNYTFHDATVGYEDFNNKKIYNVFCPFDASLSTANVADSSLIWKNPYFGFQFTSGLQMSSVLTYSFSSSAGKVYSYAAETGSVASTAYNTCVNYAMDTELHPMSTGRQQIELKFSLNGKVPLDVSGLLGYGFMRVEFDFSTSLAGLNYIASTCATESTSLMTCDVSSFLTTKWIVYFKPISVKLIDVLEKIQFTIDVTSTTMPIPSGAITYSVTIYLPTQKSSGNIRVFGDLLTAPLSTYVLLAKCTNSEFKVAVSAYLTQMAITDLAFDIPYTGARSAWKFAFSLSSPRERFYATSAIKFDFGFLSAQNDLLVTSNQLRCKVYEAAVGTSTYTLSWKWQYITYEVNLQNVRVYPRAMFTNPHQYTFQFRCEGGVVPTNSLSSSSLMGYWIDSTILLEQTGALGSYAYPSSSAILNTASISTTSFSLYSKFWMTGGFEACYTFALSSVNAAVDYFSRFFVHFASSVGVSLNRESNPECYLRTNLSTAPNVALADLTLAYCQVLGENRISVWSNKLIAQNTQFHLIIYGVAQPSQPYFASMDSKIWIGIDDDSNLSNGISCHGWISMDATPAVPSSGFDYAPFLIQKILGNSVVPTASISKVRIRSTYDFTVNFNIEPTSLIPTKYLYILFTDNFSETTRGDVFTCSLTMLSSTATNYASRCEMESNRLLRVKIASTPSSMSSFEDFFLKVTAFLSPEYVPKKIRNEVNVLLYIGYYASPTTADYVQRMSLNTQTAFFEYENDPNRIDLMWNILTYKRSNLATNLNVKVVSTSYEMERTVFVNIGYFSRLIHLLPANNSTFLLHFTMTAQASSTATTTLFKFTPTTFEAERGASYLEFKMAALPTAPAGIYLLKFDKTTDNNSLYTLVPTLKVVVSGEPCTVNTVLAEYSVPIGGISLPIEIDFRNCIPTSDVTFTPLYPVANTGNFQSKLAYEIHEMKPTTRGERMVWVLAENTFDVTRIGTSLPQTFVITGTNMKSYYTPNGIQLKWVAALTASPVASDVTSISLSPNAASFNISCSQTGIAFWVIGINPSVTPITLAQIQAKVTGTIGFIEYTDVVASDKSQMVYGSDIVYVANSNIPKAFTSLKANARYSMKYFCWNQMQVASAESTVTWKVPDNGSALLKITFSFASLLTFSQQAALTCAVQYFFSLPKARVISDVSTRCTEYPNYLNLDINNKNVKNKQDSLFPYSVYVEPDTTVAADSTNETIRTKIRAAGFVSALLATISGSAAFPSLDKVDTSIILLPDSNTSPTVSETQSREIGETLVSMFMTIQGGDGYIIVGLEEGVSNTIPTADQIRKGLNYNNTNLYTFELRFAFDQVQQEFKFIQLKPGTTYSAYFIGSNDDPSPNSLISVTNTYQFTTKGVGYAVQVSSNLLHFFVAHFLVILLASMLL